MDYFTALPNSLGIASVTLPLQESGRANANGSRIKAFKFPSSVKVHGYFGEDYHLLRVCREMERMIEINGYKAF
jgi:Asp-tRNA(Asn)/Glu-tRNA(Gln) amidotransferase A subunit family amidase